MKCNDIEKLEAVFASLSRDDAPGAVVSVRRGGRSLLRKGYGLSSIESGLVNTPATKMRIGSTTKHFASALGLMLHDEGLLSVDDPVIRWLPELPVSQGRRTLRQFMSHTGGTRDYLDLSLISNGLGIVPAEGAYAYQCRQEGENFAPGEQFIYNNGGYRMLSLVIERVLGMPLDQAMRERLFDPLGMHETSLWASDLDPLSGVAQSHLALPGGKFVKGVFPAVILGEGGIASTVDNMQRWLSHLASPTLWPRALSDELMAPTPLNNGFVNPYGLGLVAEDWRGVRVFHHAGGVMGGSCQMLAAPDHDIQIVVMTNRSDGNAAELAERLMTALVGDAMSAAPQPADPGLVASLGGEYYCADSGRYFAIDRMEDKLFLKSFGMPLPLTQSEGGELRVNLLAVIAMQVNAVHGSQGQVTAIDVTEQGRTHRCERIDPAFKAEQTVTPFAGLWRSDELGADLRIGGEGADADAVRVLGQYGRNSFKLQGLLPEACLLESTDPSLPLNGTLRLGIGADRRRQLTLDTSRTRGLVLREVASGV
ncbi:serine hydrolase [Mitsuaria sp. GD03876]|uniref:serine hydrolase domain-containing protein n=1 Tax=Mitsuaria sp. GD03876 TaxID=2975399 RepID=UPI00244D686B|nr:serine hydrolase [Mitsuaria sp. GD03876]MDH0864720.1 beta-lactamase family protein [Mitsuaria sp. GD03876]